MIDFLLHSHHMGFSRVTVSHDTEAAVIAKKLSIDFPVPRRIDDFLDPLLALTRVVEAVADFQDFPDAKNLRGRVLDAVATSASLAPELQAATLRLLKAPDVVVERPKSKTRSNQSVFVVVWAVKRIQRAFRSYGKRRDRRTISDLLGI